MASCRKAPSHVLGQQLVAPVNRGGQGLLPGWRPAILAGQQVKPVQQLR